MAITIIIETATVTRVVKIQIIINNFEVLRSCSRRQTVITRAGTEGSAALITFYYLIIKVLPLC